MSLSRLFGAHSGNLNQALDRTSSRFGVLSKNLANANVPSYRRRDMDFGITLDSAEGSESSLARRANEARGFEQDGEIRVDQSGVDVEREVVTIAETEARYRMLTEISSRYFSGLKNVIREGK